MGLWLEAMQTLAVVVVATVLAVAIGIPVGIWAARSRRASGVIRPVLDFMQTLPVFVYLIPAVFFFGIGVVPGVVATTVFAIPPAVRLTELGIRSVDGRSSRPRSRSVRSRARCSARCSCRSRCRRSWPGSTRP